MRPKLSTALSVGVVTGPVAVPLMSGRPAALRFVAVVATATSTALSMAHALERPARLRLPVEDWWRLTVRLYRPWFGRAGHGEGIALLVLPALAATDADLRRPALAAWTLMLAANPGVFTILVAPANRATLRSPTTPPADARRLRDRWELGHLVRFGCHAPAFLLLAWEICGQRVVVEHMFD